MCLFFVLFDYSVNYKLFKIKEKSPNILAVLLKSFSFSFFFFFFFFGLFAFSRAAPSTYGGSQAKGPIRAVAAGLCHSNTGSELRLRPTP